MFGTEELVGCSPRTMMLLEPPRDQPCPVDTLETTEVASFAIEEVSFWHPRYLNKMVADNQ